MSRFGRNDPSNLIRAITIIRYEKVIRPFRLRPAVKSKMFDHALPAHYHRSAGWSSPVARWAHNPKVGGSNPPPATDRHRMETASDIDAGAVSLSADSLNKESRPQEVPEGHL
jgi:hypothetical protein